MFIAWRSSTGELKTLAFVLNTALQIVFSATNTAQFSLQHALRTKIAWVQIRPTRRSQSPAYFFVTNHSSL